MKEEFRQFRNTNYYVSNLGQVKNKETGNIIKGTLTKGDYLRTYISINNTRKNFYLHRMVAEEWLDDYSDDLTVNHKNGNPLDNRLCNLEMLTRSDNVKHSYEVLKRQPAIPKKPVVQFDEFGNIIEIHESINSASKKVGVTPTAISDAVNGVSKHSAGYYWKEKRHVNLKVTKITIPSTIKYLSEYTSQLPSNVIVNKGLCGVGATTCEIRSNRKSIILCPTKNLVESKALSENILGVTGDVKDKDITPVDKIIATYDALPRLMKLIPDIFNYFLLIDEYHVLFTSYHYRRKAIKFILDNFRKFKSYCFMTATPLNNFQVLEELKGLPIIEYHWENSQKVKITIENGNSLQKNLYNYISTSYNSTYNLHIFVNSIEFIRAVVKNYKLKNYRTVCSESNKDKAEKYNLNFSRAYEPITKINFYTAASFEGVDIYDENGFTIIVADAKRENTLMDISTLMYQICGRIRNSKYNNQALLLLDTRKYRYTRWANFEEFKKEADHNELIGKEKERVFREESPLYQKGELDSYNEEKDLKYYLTIDNNQLLVDKNLKYVDLENFNLIEQVYKSNVSVLSEVQKTFDVIEEKHKELDDITLEIYESLGIKSYTTEEIKEVVFPIFKRNGINCNNVMLGRYLKPITDKSRKTINGSKKTIYSRYKN